MIVCAAIHGILTRQTRASWPDEFDAWVWRQGSGRMAVHVVKKEYVAGPFPRLNWLKNRRIARGLAAELELFKRGTGNEERGTRGVKLWLVAHSNGAVIALEAARELIARGIGVAGMILTGAACGSDIDKTGVAAMVARGRLGRAVAFSSATDRVVDCDGILGWLKFPYGDLGRVGWRRLGEPYRDRKIFTLWFAGGHTGYFAPGRMEDTFRMFYRQMLEAS